MITQDILTIIGVNIALFCAITGVLYWVLNRIDSDVKSVCTRLDKIDSRLDGHATRIDQLYKIIVDILKEKK
jgi:hypothetical protein